MSPGDGDPRHGMNGYSNLGCRCDVCRQANTAWQAKARARRRATPIPSEVKHGSENAYTNYSCRCDTCRKGHTERRRLSRQRKTEAS